MSTHTAITEEITRAVALIHQCPEWVEQRRKCDDPTPCFCRQAAEAVAKIVVPDMLVALP